MKLSVDPFVGWDAPEIVMLLHQVLHADPMSETLFARKVLLDPNFEPEGALVARGADGVAGFLLAIARRHRLEDGPDDRDRGWITLFGVAPDYHRQGVGAAMLQRGLAYLRGRGCRSAWVSPYAPGYWTPGVDVAAYPGAVAFLEANGFATVYRPISMDTALVGGWEMPAWVRDRACRLCDVGIQVAEFSAEHAPALAAFLREEFPGDWQRHIRETMAEIAAGRRPHDDLLVAHGPDGTVLGVAQHEGERFGPFGVAVAQRGRGLGAWLLFRTLEGMRRKGCHNAWFMWTDDATADRVYRAAGFRETRRYAVMRRDL